MSGVRTAAVLGAGTMGAQIAAHLANAGVPCLLLDLSADAAADGLKRARALRPDPFFTPARHTLISTAGFDDLHRLRECDWVVEAIVERLEAKRELLARVEPCLREDAIVSSNTSAIPLRAIAEGRGERFRRGWLGTHFFNPPRYLPLLEVIPTGDTDRQAFDRVVRFAERRLGKGVVIASDSPGFIANRIGIFGVLELVRGVEAGSYTVEEVDAVTGPIIGRPKTATFRTMDIVGLDVVLNVADGLAERLPEEERRAFEAPPLLRDLVSRGWTGSKAGRGFYTRAEDGSLQVLDPRTMSYSGLRRPRFRSVEAVERMEGAGDRIRALFGASDSAGEILRQGVAPMLLYAARVAPEVAPTAADVDRAMCLGFGWELGPLQTLAAAGADNVLRAAEGRPLVDDRARAAAAAAAGTPGGRGGLLTIARVRGVVRRNPGASLIDLGDGVLCLEFHSKMNTLGSDGIQMLQAAAIEASANYAALLIANDAPHFSAGANLMLLLLEAQEGNWDEVDLMVRMFQGATVALRRADVPVVVCPAGLTLGGGCEIALHADRLQAAAESYIGLVETGVGLIPAGGGTKEMLGRAVEGLPPGADVMPFVQRVFETIAFAKVSTSAPDAERLGYLRSGDGISMNRERLVADGKALAVARAGSYVPPPPREAIPVGGASTFAALKLGIHLAWRSGRISDHDALVGRKLAWILAGGDIQGARTLTEAQMLDLEREAFLSLCGERRTQERIAHTLKTGQMLRN